MTENEISKETGLAIQNNNCIANIQDEQGEIFTVYNQQIKCLYLYLDSNLFIEI